MLQILPKYCENASKGPRQEWGGGAVSPQLAPTLSTLNLPNDSLVQALGDLALAAAK